MKSSDYIVEFLASKGIRHCYGFQGTMIAHLVDSIGRSDKLTNHVCYNEQGAAYAAVGEAKVSGKPAVAYATSGPGATNLLSGISDAYFDSAPVIFITGQLNTTEYLPVAGIRQHGFQEMDVISVMKPMVKYCRMIKDPSEIRETFEAAFYYATEGRPGPVLIDLPMNMQRMEINPDEMKGFDITCEEKEDESAYENAAEQILAEIKAASRPVLMLGNGVSKHDRESVRSLIEKLGIPVCQSMLGRDILPYDHELNFGMLGSAYGHRYTNMIMNTKADLIVALGDSLCKRQTGVKFEGFAVDARIIRVDIDPLELERKIKADGNELGYLLDCNRLIDVMNERAEKSDRHSDWVSVCAELRRELDAFDESCDERLPNKTVAAISERTEAFATIAGDVGQHQLWTAQSYKVRDGQRMIFSGGYGAMGFSLPAAIGAAISTGKPALVIAGDGAFQMNIQELQWVVRERLPITIAVMNNCSLGLIQQQQDDIFEGRYFGALAEGGYDTPSFAAIGKAYGLNSYRTESIEDVEKVFDSIDPSQPNLVEVMLPVDVKAYPKTNFGDPIHRQKPYVPEELFNRLMEL